MITKLSNQTLKSNFNMYAKPPINVDVNEGEFNQAKMKNPLLKLLQPKAHSSERDKQQLTVTSQESANQIKNLITIENINTGIKQGYQNKLQDSSTTIRTPICVGQPLMNTFIEPARSLSIFKINT